MYHANVDADRVAVKFSSFNIFRNEEIRCSECVDIERHFFISEIFFIFLDVDTINETCTALNHTLVNHLLERLIFASHAEVEQEFIPEAAVDKVACSVFCAAYI